VLQEFSSSESEALDEAVDRASAAAETFVMEGIAAAMDRHNAVPADPEEPD
jgi:hypothetical protein